MRCKNTYHDCKIEDNYLIFNEIYANLYKNCQVKFASYIFAASSHYIETKNS